MSEPNTKPVQTGHIYDARTFAETNTSGSIDLGLISTDRERTYHMAADKSLAQMYYEEVEALKSDGMPNAEAIRQVAQKHGKNENAVRGGIHQYRSRHVNGGGPSTSPGRRSRRTSAATVDDYLANARHALEAARDLIDQEVNEAKTALDSAQRRYDEVAASAKDRKADIEKKLKAVA